MKRFTLALLVISALSACGRTAPVPIEQQAAAHDAVNLEYELKGPRRFIDTWYTFGDPTGGTMCGTFEPQPIEKPFGPVRRYMYSESIGLTLDPIPELQITISPFTTSIIERNKTLFNQNWELACKDFQPSPFKQVAE